jgi:hypothetical protein
MRQTKWAATRCAKLVQLDLQLAWTGGPLLADIGLGTTTTA